MKNKILAANVLIVTGIMMACGNADKDQNMQSEEISQESENTVEVQESTAIEDDVNSGDATTPVHMHDDYAEENVMEDFCGMFESIDGYVYAAISPTEDYGIVEVVLGSLEYDDIEYDFYANLKENGDDYHLEFSDDVQTIEISKEYFEEYDSDGIYWRL